MVEEKYVDRDENGKIIRIYGGIQYEGQESIQDDDQEYLDFIDPPKTYVDYRKERYLSDLGDIGDQLDIMYWDKINGTSVWEDTITQIKTDIPKPS